MSSKTIIVACASSMITSTVAVNKIKSLVEKHNLDQPKILQMKFSEISGALKTNDVDLIVPTGKLGKDISGDIPVVSGMPFITGINEDKTVSEIVEILSK